MNVKPPDGWHIEYNPKPIPIRSHDYDFWHDDYDYATDTGDNGLAGTAKSEYEALMNIYEIIDSRINKESE